MRMEKVRLQSLSEPVRSFLSRVRAGKGLVVEDDQGRAVAQVLPANETEASVAATPAAARSTPAERQQAWKRIQKLQRKVSKSMQAQGVTEDDVVREVLKDD